jgi:putative ABC transport system ATP-binding protein
MGQKSAQPLVKLQAVGTAGRARTGRNAAQPLIKLEALSKVFAGEGVETSALVDVDLEIDNGEFVAIAGPSGCGKSTLLSILGLLDSPSEGTYLINGRPVAHLHPAARALVRNRDIGFIFQSYNLIGEMTVFENVELPLTYREMPAAEREHRVYATLERIGMADRAKYLPGQLSGGQQQRVAVARAVAGDPVIVLADEPTGNLDSRSGDAVIDLLLELHAHGATVCMVTHEPQYAAYAQRTIHLFDGRIDQEQLAVCAEQLVASC